MLKKLIITILIITALFVAANILTREGGLLTPPHQPPAHDKIREAVWCFDHFIYKMDEYSK